jgi:hypothetical protein
MVTGRYTIFEKRKQQGEINCGRNKKKIPVKDI